MEFDRPKVKHIHTMYRSAHSPRFHKLLSDVLDDVTISMEDCRSPGIIANLDLNGLFSSNLWDTSYALGGPRSWLAGRVATSDIHDSETGEMFVRSGEIVDNELVSRSGILTLYWSAFNGQVSVRHPLSCQAERGICSRCYGLEYPERNFLEVGTPIGSKIAALISEQTKKAGFKHPRFFVTGFMIGAPKQPRGEKLKLGIEPKSAYKEIANYLEARSPKHSTILSKQTGSVSFGRPFPSGKQRMVITDSSGEQFEYIFPREGRLFVKEGDFVEAGEEIFYRGGEVDPKDVLEIFDEFKALLLISSRIIEKYWYAGVDLNYNQIEVVVREMLNWVNVTDSGDSVLSVGETVSRRQFNFEVDRITQRGGRIPTSMKCLLGLSDVYRHKCTYRFS